MIRFVLAAVAFLCIGVYVYGADEPSLFSGGYILQNGGVRMSDLPPQVHGKDVSSDKFKAEYLIWFLGIYEENLRKGTLSEALEYRTFESRYLCSFIGDKRFSSIIYNQYSERLFEEFGDEEGSAILLYYQTGGSLEKLRALYQQPVNDSVKEAIEACFSDASLGLFQRKDGGSTNEPSQILSVRLSVAGEVKKSETADQGVESLTSLCDPISVFKGADSANDKYDMRELYVEYKNITEDMLIRIKVPRGEYISYGRYRRFFNGFNIMRKDGIPVLSEVPKRIDKNQTITLYPGDHYIVKAELNFSVEYPPSTHQLFAHFGKNGVVLNKFHWLGNADDTFRIIVCNQSSYISARSADDFDSIKSNEWNIARSNFLEFSYTPIKGCQVVYDKWPSYKLFILNSWKNVR